MNREEYIKKIQNDHACLIEMINLIPEGLEIRSACNSFVVFEVEYDEVEGVRRELRKTLGNYTLANYYENTGYLSIRYVFDKLDVIFYCTDFDYALKQMGNGKCSLEAFDTTENRIVCSV